ncbi:MAG: DinB family protein, partial [Candidatus Rokubacteria bacterium]|nr:DinB family protein [Candidatus Rokubacteria bacterium]
IVKVLDGAPPGPGIRVALPGDMPARTAEEWWDRLRSDREALFDRVRAADPGARLDATIEHPFFGPLNWRETLLFMRLHDLDHAGQLRNIAAALA